MNCLICYQKNKYFTKDSNNAKDFFKGCTAEDENAVSRELSVIFVVRNILEIPSEFCEYLISSEGNPSSWGIQFCTVCERIIQEAQFIFNRIKKLVDEFDELKVTLKDAARTSFKSPAGKSRKIKGKHGSNNITEDIRQQFCENKSNRKQAVQAKHEIPTGIQGTSEVIVKLMTTDLSKYVNENIDEDFDDSPSSPFEMEVDDNVDSNDDEKAVILKNDSGDDSDSSVDSNGFKYHRLVDGKIPCPVEVCSYTSSNKLIIKAHVSRKHFGKKQPYKCNACKLTFQRPSKLKEHKCKRRKKSKISKRIRQTRRRRRPTNFIIKNVRSVVNNEVTVKQEKLENGSFSEIFDDQLVDQENNNEEFANAGSEDAVDAEDSDPEFADNFVRRSSRARKPIQKVVSDDESDTNDCDKKRKDPSGTPSMSPDWRPDYDDDKFDSGRYDRLRSNKIHKTNTSSKKFKNGTRKRKHPHKFEFGCPQCNFSFPKEYMLEAHIIRQHQGHDLPFSCDLCAKRFQRLAIVLLHIDRKHPEDESIQPPVLNRFDDDQNTTEGGGNTNVAPEIKSGEVIESHSSQFKPYQRRIKSHRNKYSCHECGFSFKEEYVMDAHVLRKHYGDQNPFPCDFCKRRFQRISALLKHREYFHPNNLTTYIGYYEKCDQENKCDPTVTEPTTDQNEETHQFRCPTCTKRFESLETLDEHLAIQHEIKRPHVKINKASQSNTEKSVVLFESKCTECSMEFSSSLKCEAHLHRVHYRANSQLNCGECSRKFLTKKGLEEHIASEHDEMSPPKIPKITPKKKNGGVKKSVEERRIFMCEFCSNSYTAERYLEEHQTQCHYEELQLTPNVCKFCNKILSSARTLEFHVKTVHENDCRFKCESCPRSFHFKPQLQNHINIFHTGEKPFKCQQCPKKFAAKCYLANHMRLHTGYKPYKCKSCSKEFSDQPTYRRHMETHGSIIHKCPECGKEFKVWHAFRLHLKIHQPKDKAPQKPRKPRKSRKKEYIAETSSEDSSNQYNTNLEPVAGTSGTNVSRVPVNTVNDIVMVVPEHQQLTSMENHNAVSEITQWQSQEIAFPKLVSNSIELGNYHQHH